MSKLLQFRSHLNSGSSANGDHGAMPSHGRLHTRIISSGVGTHTTDFLERKLSFITNRYLPKAPRQPQPEIIIHQHFQDYTTSDAARTFSMSTTTTWRGSLNTEEAARILPHFTPNQVQYQELMFELMATEAAYFADLYLLMKDFGTVLLEWDCLPFSLRMVFKGIPGIVSLHGSLLGELQDNAARNGRIILDMIQLFQQYIPHFFDVYKDYFLYFESANDLVARMMENPEDMTMKELYQFTMERLSETKYRSLTLQAFLLKPIQRLMKYPLFLKSLIDTLPDMSDECQRHIHCMNEMDSEIRRLEGYKGHMERFRDLENRVKGLDDYRLSLPDPSRYLVHQGYLTFVPTSSLSGLQEKLAHNQLYVFLFNDVILFTKIRSKKLSDADAPIKLSQPLGPDRYTLFKLVLPPSQLTHLDRFVKAKLAMVKTTSRYKSMRFRPSNGSSASVYLSGPHVCQDKYDPRQFICSVAHKNIMTLCLEASAVGDKELWCNCLQMVWDQHCKR